MTPEAVGEGAGVEPRLGTGILESYAAVAGREVVDHLRQLARRFEGIRIVHVNSTREGGGVAEILTKLLPLSRELGIDARWEVITGNEDFYRCTKGIHNALQGRPDDIPEELLEVYAETNERNAAELRDVLADADVVIIHDPQPAPLIHHFPERKGRWIWRCHIDLSHPYRPVWHRVREHVEAYDASIFSLASFTRQLPHPQYLIAPSIDPLSDKNVELGSDEATGVLERFDLDPARPLMLQVSRFDRFKDPLGVIEAYRMVRPFVPSLQLVLAGGGASDDPEGGEVLAEVEEAAGGDPGIHVLLLPPDSHREINALQRAADVVLQKSLREGFGLTVTEAMWKGKPVIGGNTGGIRIQIDQGRTGFLVDTPEGAALRARYLLRYRDRAERMGRKGRESVRNNFLLTRQLREELTLVVGLLHADQERIELNAHL